MARCKLSTDIPAEDAENLAARPFMRVVFVGLYRAAIRKFEERLNDLVVCLLRDDALVQLVDRNSASGNAMVVVFEPDGVVPLSSCFSSVAHDLISGRPVTALHLRLDRGVFEEVDILGVRLRPAGDVYDIRVEFRVGDSSLLLDSVDAFYIPDVIHV